MTDALFIPTAVLFFGAALEIVLAAFLSRAAKGWLAFATAVIAFLAVAALVPEVRDGRALEATLLDWDVAAPLAYHVDGLSVLFMLMGTGIGAAILLYSVGYMEEEEQGTTRFYALMLVFVGGLVLLVCAANLLLMYFAWELIGLCSYFLVSFWYQQQAAADGARKVLVITHITGYGLMAAVVLLYARTGTMLWTEPAVAAALSPGIVLLMLVAAMGKSVMYPVHTWIPEAMNAPTPVSALLHSACYVKAGVFLIARMYSMGPWQSMGGPLLLVGCVTMFVGVVFALKQTDLKRLLAFHTVSQLGYIVVGLALNTSLGIAAGLFYLFSHALFKGTLFLCAGAVQHATGTRDLRQLGGLWSRMPVTTTIWITAAAAIMGVPMTNGFVSKWLIFEAALDAHQAVVVLIGWAVSMLTAFSFLKATVSAFFGDPPAGKVGTPEIHEVPKSMLLGMGVLAASCVVFGVAPQLLLAPVVAPAVQSLGFAWDVQTSWLGVGTGTGSVGVTVGAVVVLTAALLGAGAYRLERVTGATAVPVFSGGDPLPVGDRLGPGDFADMAETAFKPVYSLDPDPLYLRIWATIRDFTSAAGCFVAERVQRHAPFAVAACVAALCVGVWLL